MFEFPGRSYSVRLGKLPPEAKSPKDDLLWGWPATTTRAASEGASGADGCPIQQIWPTSQVLTDMVRTGLWMYEATEAELPTDLSLLSPAADVASLERVAAVVREVAHDRDTGASAVDGCRAVPLTRAALTSGEARDGKNQAKKKRKAGLNAASSGTWAAPPNARAERRLFHELAHAHAVRHWAPDSSAVILSPPQNWPFLLDGGVVVAGRAVDECVAAAAATIPKSSRLGLVSRRGQIGHRLTVLFDAEVAAARASGVSPAALIADVAGALSAELDAITSVPLAPGTNDGVFAIRPPLHSRLYPDCTVAGVVPVAVRPPPPRVRVTWPAATRWRAMRGLEDVELSVEIGL